MINFPTPPTDNLYKFVALTGLILLIFAFIYPLQLISDLELRTVDTNTKISLLAVEKSNIEEDLATAKKSKKLSFEEIESLADRSRKFQLKSVEVDGEHERLGTLTKQLRFVWNALTILIVFGFGMTCVGFYCWYYRVQKVLDKNLSPRQLRRKVGENRL